MVGSVVDDDMHAIEDGPSGKVFSNGGLALIMNSFCEKFNVSYRSSSLSFIKRDK